MSFKQMSKLLESNAPIMIGLLGNKGCGKDSVGRVLVEEYGFYQTAFAREVYNEVAAAFGVSVQMLEDRETKETPMSWLKLSLCSDGDFWASALVTLQREHLDLQAPGAKPEGNPGWMLSTDHNFILSPRKALQLWGTEYRRARDNFYWIRKVQEELKRVEANRVVITDLREPHEAAYVKRQDNSTVVLITRDNNPFYQAGQGLAAHSSETQVNSIAYDVELRNYGNLVDLGYEVAALMGQV